MEAPMSGNTTTLPSRSARPLVIVAAAVPFLYAQPMRHHGGGEFGFFGRLDKAKDKLGLTDDQVAQIKAIGQDLKTKNAPYRDQARGGFQSIATTLLNNPNDVAAAQTLLWTRQIGTPGYDVGNGVAVNG